MRKYSVCLFLFIIIAMLGGCRNEEDTQILATTKPIYQFASILCEETPLQVDLLISENVSCLHDYTLQVSQMRKLESAEVIIINGAGFEDFLTDALPKNGILIDCSENIVLHCSDHNHHDDHSYAEDPHIWLSIHNARTMVNTIYATLCDMYPQHRDAFEKNFRTINAKFELLESHSLALHDLQCRELITFHDGFAYLAESFDLHILRAIEEESGSEASAKELIEIVNVINRHNVPAIFTEVNSATSASNIIQAETGVNIFELDMALSERDYFEAMEHNIKTLKEALE